MRWKYRLLSFCIASRLLVASTPENSKWRVFSKLGSIFRGDLGYLYENYQGDIFGLMILIEIYDIFVDSADSFVKLAPDVYCSYLLSMVLLIS